MKKILITLTVILTLVSGQLFAVPNLNSYPTASATLYLDFDGHVVSSSVWNFGNKFTCTPAILNDDNITEVFNRVAEDFRPFNLNVTTDLSKFLAAPLDKRMRVVVTPTSAWYPTAAGVSYITSFAWGDDTPCFVFADRLGNDPKKIAENISHESGHTMGLNHQANFTNGCTLISSYHIGSGTGVTSWGPIMGNVASKTLTQWNFGPTPSGCNVVQDNLSIITSKNGFGYRPDDVSDIYLSASVINVAQNNFSRSGVISTSLDKDIYRFDLSQKASFILNAEPYSVSSDYSGANLDIKLELQDNKGNTIKVYDPKDSLNARIDTILNSGTYYLIVDGTGNINSNNDYGSLGSYSFEGVYKGITNQSMSTSSMASVAASITGSRIKDGNLISWPKNAISIGESITILYSDGENDFKELARPDAKTTSYIHNVKTSGIYFYKLKITEKSGVVRFSNAIQIEVNAAVSVFKVVKQPQQPVLVNSTEPYEYRVVDNNGRVIQAGKAMAGSKAIDVRNYPAGIYNLQLINLREQLVERFMNK